MSSHATLGRHRAEIQRNAHLSALARAVTENAGGVGRQAVVIAAASGMVLSTAVSASAAEAETDRATVTTTLEIQAAPLTVQAESEADVSFNRTAVKSVAAPVVAEAPVAEAAPEVALQSEAVVPEVAEVNVAVDTPDAPEASSGVAATIAAAAQAQLGVSQDCTRLVSNSLAAAGINFHGWPAGYLSLGSTVSADAAIPGDLIYYEDGGMGLAHIAVYIGNGQAVHGGFNGNSTVIDSAFIGSGPTFIRVGG